VKALQWFPDFIVFEEDSRGARIFRKDLVNTIQDVNGPVGFLSVKAPGIMKLLPFPSFCL
jgi:hypothetical protein